MKRQQNSRGGIIYCLTPNCSCKASDVTEVEALLMQALREIVDSFEEEYPQLETLADEAAAHRKKLEHTRQEISRLEKQLENLFDLLEQGIYDQGRPSSAGGSAWKSSWTICARANRQPRRSSPPPSRTSGAWPK